ncbi:kinase-like domain-containing protein, partial [Hysterangium stoloniferum]
HHPNLMRVLGRVSPPLPFPSMISPWYRNGSVDEYLRTNPDFRQLKEIADGLRYLHDNDVIHGDLRAANVLVSDEGSSILTNFGLVPMLETVAGISTSLPSSYRWMAPELLSLNSCYSFKTDMYAFGSTILEILSGAIPYSQIEERSILSTVMKNIGPLHLSGKFIYDIPYPQDLVAALNKCWSCADERPQIEEIQEVINKYGHS